MSGVGKDLRIAIVGAGRMGRKRSRAATTLGARVVSVCDADFSRVRELASEFQANAITDPGQITWESLDALFVCTPPGSRGHIEIPAIRAAVPLFVEKPVGACADQALPVLRALRVQPVLDAVGYMNRYRDSVLHARQLVAQGSPLAVAFQWVATRYRVPWWSDSVQSGGPLNEQCTHFIDLCRFLIGEIDEVQATARPLADVPDLDGAVAMTLRFRNGVLAAGLYACEATEKQIAFEVFLPGGSVRLEGWDLRLKGDRTPSGQPEREEIFVNEVAAFFQAIRTGDRSPIRSDFEDAMKTQIVVDALGRAVRSGLAETVTATHPPIP